MHVQDKPVDVGTHMTVSLNRCTIQGGFSTVSHMNLGEIYEHFSKLNYKIMLGFLPPWCFFRFEIAKQRIPSRCCARVDSIAWREAHTYKQRAVGLYVYMHDLDSWIIGMYRVCKCRSKCMCLCKRICFCFLYIHMCHAYAKKNIGLCMCLHHSCIAYLQVIFCVPIWVECRQTRGFMEPTRSQRDLPVHKHGYMFWHSRDH